MDGNKEQSLGKKRAKEIKGMAAVDHPIVLFIHPCYSTHYVLNSPMSFYPLATKNFLTWTYKTSGTLAADTMR